MVKVKNVNFKQLEAIQHNVECIQKQLSHIFDFEGENGAIMVNNYDWAGSWILLHFCGIMGNTSVSTICWQKIRLHTRLETGISFTEFTYTILQAMDFLHLYEKHNCKMQIGGSDQWGNITTGLELIRKMAPEGSKRMG